MNSGLCDDGVDCTNDVCDATLDCLNTPNDFICDDGTECTSDLCDAVAGCINTVDEFICDDGVDCTLDSCDVVSGTCVNTPTASLCDDGLFCTIDVCDTTLGCLSGIGEFLFDESAVDLLESLNCPAYKIASFEIVDLPLIEYIAKKQKPIIMSTGIASFDDIKLAVETCRKAGNNNITILKCTSSYPAPIEEANLLMMQKFARDFDVKVGLSDHTIGNLVPILAVANGASVIEKHFKLNDKVGGPDASFSIDEQEFKLLVDEIRKVERVMGIESYNFENLYFHYFLMKHKSIMM